MKSAKGGRKISLPWFRQSSVQQSHAALSRQHTIDTPGSFRSYVSPSQKAQVGIRSLLRRFSPLRFEFAVIFSKSCSNKTHKTPKSNPFISTFFCILIVQYIPNVFSSSGTSVTYFHDFYLFFLSPHPPPTMSFINSGNKIKN